MRLTSTHTFKIQDYQLEIFPIQDNVINTYPAVEKGYLLHFYLGEHSINNWEDNDFKFSLEHDLKIIIPGLLPSLEKKMNEFKDNLLLSRESLVDNLDQFGYIFMFIVKQDNIYQLVISSDSIGLDQLSSIYCSE